MAKNKKIHCLVTGSGGFLGTVLCKKLKEKGYKVTGFSRNYYPHLNLLGVKQIQGDLGNISDIKKACNNVNVIFNCAAKLDNWGKYKEFYKTNVNGVINIIDSIKQNQILIHTSSPSAIMSNKDLEGVDESIKYPNIYFSHYAKTKAKAEKIITRACKNGLKSIILRPHIIWGPGDNNIIPRIMNLRKKIIIIGNGKNFVDTVYIDNAADAHILAMDALLKTPKLTGNKYFICQNEPIKIWELIKEILSWKNINLGKKFIPSQIAYIGALFFEFFYKIFHLKGEPLLTRYIVNEFSKNHWFDTTAAKNDLNFIPKISLKKGLIKTKKWIQDNF
jgi:nucleoside-diphosphate-sugar epimerase